MKIWVHVETGSLVVAETRPVWGHFKLRGAEPAPVVEEPVVQDSAPVAIAEPAPARVAPAFSRTPSTRATVREWVEFMAANGIEHPEDATKAEMKKIADQHLAGEHGE